jgi:hypothetical protein
LNTEDSHQRYVSAYLLYCTVVGMVNEKER